MAERQVVETLRRYMRALAAQGITPEFAVLYGSFATNSQHEFSDIDVLIVAGRFDESLTRQDINLLWRLAALVDSRIEPIPVGLAEWRARDARAIVEIARAHGETVPFDDAA